MSFPGRPVEIDSIVAEAARIWRWWVGELSILIPPPWKERLLGAAEFLVFDRGPDSLILQHFAGSSREVLYRSDGLVKEEEELLPPHILEIVTHRRRLGVPLILRLPRSEVLFRSVRLPKTAAGELEKLLSYEIERQSPLAREAVLYDHKTHAVNAPQDRMDVKLRILRRDLVDRALRSVTRLTGGPDAIGVIEAAPPKESELFHFGRKRNLRVWARRNLPFLLSAVLLLLVAANLWVAYERREAAIEEMNQRLAAITEDVDRAVSLQNEIREAEQRATFGATKKKHAPLIDILNDVAAVLPDDSWIFEFNYKDDTVRLRGFTPDASTLLRTVDGASRFGEAEFRAPVMPGRQAEAERFDISFKAGGGEQ